MTPLIDVVFLIIIFFIMMMNFSEILIRNVNLPQADESQESKEPIITMIPITIQSEKIVFVNRSIVPLDNLEENLRQKIFDPEQTTAQLRGDENIPYEVVQNVLQAIASAGITRIEFSTRIEDKDGMNEASR